MPEKTDWEAQVANILKAELKRRGVTYGELVKRLGEMGIEEKDVNIRNKLARGKFTAVFFLQCLVAVGAQTIRLEDLS